MKRYDLILFDIDGTLLDFEKAEKVGMKETLTRFGLRNDDEVLDAYNEINISHWQMFEVGKLSLDKLLVRRHEALFERYGFQQDAAKFNDYYESRLKNCGYLVEHALDVLDFVKSKFCKMAIITNGLYETQTNRIAISKLNEYFQHIYISEKIGYSKPQKEIFELALFELKVGPENIIFIDDKPEHIKAAASLGIHTILFEDTNKTISQILQLVN